jgi:hypothetical protein
MFGEEKRIVAPLEIIDDFITSFNIMSPSDWDKNRKLYNNKKYFIPKSCTCFFYYGKTSSEIIQIPRKTRLPIKDIIKLMIKNKVHLSNNIKNEWRTVALIYNKNSDTFYIPGDIYCCGKISELFHGYLVTGLIKELMIHLEDLILLDKTQLLQIAFLKKLPKDIYEEILECPKGEKRRQLLENLSDRLEAIKEDEGQKTFEDSLDEAIEATEGVQESEEKKFRDDLKTGIDLAEKPGRFNPEEKIKEIFEGISVQTCLWGCLCNETAHRSEAFVIPIVFPGIDSYLLFFHRNENLTGMCVTLHKSELLQ